MKSSGPSIRLLFLTLASVLLASGDALGRDLTFEQRVAAQETIERVYYSHQLGATLPFETAVPRSVIENKVQKYLKESDALQKIWHSPDSGEALRSELARIARSTKYHDRDRKSVE